MSRGSTLLRALWAAVFTVGVGAAVGLGAGRAIAAGASVTGATSFTALPMSLRETSDVALAPYVSPLMSVEVVLAPRDQSALATLLTNLYAPGSSLFHQWLRKGEFSARFAPTSAQASAVSGYLQASGLTVSASSSPFLLRATGSSAAISAAFRTSLRLYRGAGANVYFANASAVQLPSAIAPQVLGIVGLTNTVRAHPQLRRPSHAVARGAAKSCETPYVTRDELFAAYNVGTSFAYGYGGGPQCSGLTPAQINSIYGAPSLGSSAKGAGVNLGVFELSAYQRSDIAHWAHTFYGATFRAPLVDIIVDGGPLSPICPSHDQCTPASQAYNGDGEVDADIEMQLSVAPAASHILVYNAPNDATGQTSLDEFSQMANDDLADVISSSWGLCESDAGAAYVRAENVLFEQMALQGQSVFSAAGDDGAFDCLTVGSDGTTLVEKELNVDDPPSQPWVTSVGGTSLESFNPGTNPRPGYATGRETVWNVDDLCNSGPNVGGTGGNDFDGYFWCYQTGAGGGGNSQFWSRPFYQSGPDVTNPYSTYGNGRTHCSFAATGTACREVPDVSANADQFTPYADYCTGNAATPGSSCTGSYSGWGGSGGTSLSSPLWSAIIADRDSLTGARVGNANEFLYLLYNLNPRGYFHDITAFGHSTTNNGFFPTAAGFDLATGIGTPKMSAIITGMAQP